MTNFESVRKFMETFGQEIKEKASFPNDKISSLRYDLIKEELDELKEAMDKKDIKEVEGIVKDILKYEEEFSKLSHDELRDKTIHFKEIIKKAREPFSLNIDSLNSKIESTNNIDQKDDYYNEIDELKEKSNTRVEEILNDILPQAFAVVKETAKRFKENSKIKVKATEFDL